MFNRAPSNTIKKNRQNCVLFFSNMHEKSLLYQFKIFITKMHRCCQEKVIYSVTHLKPALVRVSCGLVFLTHPLEGLWGGTFGVTEGVGVSHITF